MKWWKLCRIICGCGLMVALAGCEDGDSDGAGLPPDPVVGRWVDTTDSTEILTVEADGDWKWHEERNVDRTAEGTWSRTATNEYTAVGRASNDKDVNSKWVLNGDTLTMSPHPETGSGSDEYRRL